MTVGEMSQRMSMSEYQNWMRLQAIQPIGDRQTHILMATLCSIVASIGGAKSTPAMFLPQPPKPQRDTADVTADIMRFFKPLIQKG
jgi:hypothetical protein